MIQYFYLTVCPWAFCFPGQNTAYLIKRPGRREKQPRNQVGGTLFMENKMQNVEERFWSKVKIGKLNLSTGTHGKYLINQWPIEGFCPGRSIAVRDADRFDWETSAELERHTIGK